MKKHLLFSAFLCVLVSIAHAQTVSITANPGTTPNAGLGFSNYHVSEYIYTQTEIGASNFTTAATAIKRINLNAAVTGTPNFFNNVKIYLKTVPLATTTLAAATYSTAGYTEVFSGTFTAPTTGWVGVELTTPFVRTAGTNLQMMIERTDNIDHSAVPFTWTSANGNNTSATAVTSRRYNGTAALTAATSLTTSAFRVAVQFVSPVAVDATLTNISSGISETILTCYNTTNFSVVLSNNGTNSIAAGAAAVTFRIGSPNAYSLTKTNTSTLIAGATETIVFSNVNVGNGGDTRDSAYVVLPGDLERANDTIKSSFFTTTRINVSSGAPAIEGAETTLPVFIYLDQLAGADQLWELNNAPSKYKNPGLSDSLGAHGGTTFYFSNSYDGAAGSVSRLFSNCLTLPATTGGCASNISFWLSHDTSYRTDLDSMYLSISTNQGATWTRLAGYQRYGATYTTPTWVQETYNLSAYQGQTFQLGFEGVSKYGNIIGLDDITISSTCVLPVALVTFKGERRGSLNNLEWTTATEANNSGFELQRSADGINFSKLAFVSSKAATGNSNAATTYSFNDVKPFSSNGYYRLKQLDKDGKATLSNIVLIKGNRVSVLTVSSIYPNPVTDNIKLVITAAAQQTVTLSIVDFTGKTISTKLQQAAAGDNTIQINTTNLATGSYLLKATNSLGETSIQKFIKQ